MTTKGKKLLKSQIKLIKDLDKTGMVRTEIARQTGINYHQVIYCLLRAGRRKRALRQPKVTDVVSKKPSEVDYKPLYLKAVSLLVEHGIIEVTF